MPKMITVTDFSVELLNLVTVFSHRCCLWINSSEDNAFRFFELVIAKEHF